MRDSANRPHPDRVLAAWAETHFSVISSAELAALGFDKHAVARRQAAGRLHRRHPGVHAIGQRRIPREGRWRAAVLACGPGALLSHRSAEAARAFSGRDPARIDVTVPGMRGRMLDGVRVHRSTLHPDDVSEVDGIPCTSVARTLVDLAAVADRREVERAMDQAEALQLFDLRAVEAVLDRRRGARGVALVRAILAEHRIGTTLTDGEIAERFLVIVRRIRLRDPEFEVSFTLPDGTPIRIDALWREHRLAVELDGRRTHATRARFESDRRRDQLLTIAGLRPVRFTWRQIEGAPREVGRTLLALAA